MLYFNPSIRNIRLSVFHGHLYLVIYRVISFKSQGCMIAVKYYDLILSEYLMLYISNYNRI